MKMNSKTDKGRNNKNAATKSNRTELVFVLDKSGSMYGLEKDTIGGFNSMLNKQREADGCVTVSTILFNHSIEYVHDRFDIGDVAPMSETDYVPSGTTALLDAIGSAVQKEIAVQRHLPEESRADKVIFVIITDGYENSSKEYSYETVKKLIEEEQNKYGWEFLFLGANIDAVSEGARFGIREDRAVRYKSDSIGTALNYEVVADTIRTMSGMPTDERMDGTWMEEILEDVKKRGE